MDNKFKVGKSDDGGERVSSRRRGPRPSLLRSVGAELAGCLQLAKCLSGWCRWCRWCPQQPPAAPRNPQQPTFHPFGWMEEPTRSASRLWGKAQGGKKGKGKW